MLSSQLCCPSFEIPRVSWSTLFPSVSSLTSIAVSSIDAQEPSYLLILISFCLSLASQTFVFVCTIFTFSCCYPWEFFLLVVIASFLAVSPFVHHLLVLSPRPSLSDVCVFSGHCCDYSLNSTTLYFWSGRRHRRDEDGRVKSFICCFNCDLEDFKSEETVTSFILIWTTKDSSLSWEGRILLESQSHLSLSSSASLAATTASSVSNYNCLETSTHEWLLTFLISRSSLSS
jgi:hypothetical protein